MTTPQSKLRESIVKGAIEHLDWTRLKTHLDEIAPDDASAEALLGHLRRSSTLILRYPDSNRESRRAAFFQSLSRYFAETFGGTAASSLQEELALLDKVEHGYRGILQTLDGCDISGLPPEKRLAAYISRAEEEFSLLMARHDEAAKRAKEILIPQGVLLAGESGERFSMDHGISSIVESFGITLLMEAHKNRLFDAQGHVLLPPLPAATEEDRYKAGSTQVLATCWQQWERTEERRRFLGGEFEEHSAPDLPSWVPEGIRHVYIYHPTKMEFFDFAANERLNERLILTYMEMSVETGMEAQAAGIGGAVPLLPAAFVSAEEAHTAVALCEILNYSIAEDTASPGGLRFIEWLRGYAVLKELAQKQQSASNNTQHVFSMTPDELQSVLTRCGLTEERARTFIDLVTLGKSAKDLFDCPLVKTAEGALMVFGFALYSANLARIIFSSIAGTGEPLSRKGKAFERETMSFLKEQGLRAESFTVHREGEEFEYDVTLLWNHYLFVFECKNRGLSNNHPIQAYYFELERRSSAKQVNRLVDALAANPDILRERFDVEPADIEIVPCVLHALPYSRVGKVDGVYFTDASALRRFFQERYFHVRAPHQIDENVRLLHRATVRSAWTGDQPAPEDLIGQLEHPFQLELIMAHTTLTSLAVPLGPQTAFAAEELVRTPMTVESYAEFAGVSAQGIRNDLKAVSDQVRQLKRKASRRRKGKGKRRR